MEILLTATGKNGLLLYLSLSLLAGFAVVAVLQLIGRRTSFASRLKFPAASSRYLTLLIFTMAFLGSAVGITGGWSRVGVVGDIIPAALGLIGGLLVYLFDKSKTKALAAIPAALTFSVTVYVGYVLGAELRTPVDRFNTYRDMCFTALSNASVLENEETYCRFLTGAGDWCWDAIFKNRIAYSSNSAPGSQAYDDEWRAEQLKRRDHMTLECHIRKRTLEQKVMDAAKGN